MLTAHCPLPTAHYLFLGHGLEEGPCHAAQAEMQVYGTEFRDGRQTGPGWHHALKQEA